MSKRENSKKKFNYPKDLNDEDSTYNKQKKKIRKKNK